jgi:hypothetical protein
MSQSKRVSRDDNVSYVFYAYFVPAQQMLTLLFKTHYMYEMQMVALYTANNTNIFHPVYDVIDVKIKINK